MTDWLKKVNTIDLNKKNLERKIGCVGKKDPLWQNTLIY